MAGIQVHTSAPINPNSETAADGQQDTTSGASSIQQSAAGLDESNVAPPAGTTPSKTVPPPPKQYPPPPQPGQTPTATNQTSYAMPPMPAAGNLPSLQTGATYPGQANPQPTRQDLSHPPGYQQQTTSFQDRPDVEGQSSNTLFNTPSIRRGGDLLDTGTTNDSLTEQSPIWDTAKSWAKAAGNKLSTTEAQVWKMVNGEK